MSSLGELVHSCWLIESGRARVLESRGHDDSAERTFERADLIAKRAAVEGTEVNEEFAQSHSGWISEVAGTEEETGVLGFFFLQRLGNYVEVHMERVLEGAPREKMIDLGKPDAEAVAAAIQARGVPSPPPPEFPETPEVHAPGSAHTRVGVIGDPHVGLNASDRIIPVVIGDLNNEGVDLTIVIGDLTQNGRADLFVRAREMFEALRSPWLVTLGNHDMWGYDTERAVGLERFASAFDRDPFGVAEANGVRTVMINSADPTASPFPPYDITLGAFTGEPNEAVPGGRIDEEMEAWMSTVEPGPPTFAFLHHPPYPYMGFPPLIFGLDEPSTGRLSAFVERIGAWGVMCGHTHRSVAYELAGIPFLETISSKEWPFAYGILEVSDQGWSYNLRPISDQRIIDEESSRYSVLHRRYIRGEKEARAFVGRRG